MKSVEVKSIHKNAATVVTKQGITNKHFVELRLVKTKKEMNAVKKLKDFDYLVDENGSYKTRNRY
jgi:hypothetical protein